MSEEICLLLAYLSYLEAVVSVQKLIRQSWGWGRSRPPWIYEPCVYEIDGASERHKTTKIIESKSSINGSSSLECLNMYRTSSDQGASSGGFYVYRSLPRLLATAVLWDTSGVGREGGKGAWMRVQVRGFPYAFAYIFRFRGAQNHTVTTAKLRELSRPRMCQLTRILPDPIANCTITMLLFVLQNICICVLQDRELPYSRSIPRSGYQPNAADDADGLMREIVLYSYIRGNTGITVSHAVPGGEAVPPPTGRTRTVPY